MDNKTKHWLIVLICLATAIVVTVASSGIFTTSAGAQELGIGYQTFLPFIFNSPFVSPMPEPPRNVYLPCILKGADSQIE